MSNAYIVFSNNGCQKTSPPLHNGGDVFFVCSMTALCGDSLFCDPDPVGIYPATITLGIGLYGYETELGSNPLAFLHLELIAAGRELLTVLTPGKGQFGILHLQAQVDVLVDARLVVDLVDSCRLQRRDG